MAQAKGFSNPRSVTNRILVLKKKYGIPLGSGSGRSIDPDAPVTPKKPKLASSNGVTKNCASPKKGKAKSVKAKKQESDDEAEVDGDGDADAESVSDFFDDDILDVGNYQVDDSGKPFSYKALEPRSGTKHEKQLHHFYQKALEKAAEDEVNEATAEEEDYM